MMTLELRSPPMIAVDIFFFHCRLGPLLINRKRALLASRFLFCVIARSFVVIRLSWMFLWIEVFNKGFQTLNAKSSPLTIMFDVTTTKKQKHKKVYCYHH
jgi:hypothetical protein